MVTFIDGMFPSLCSSVYTNGKFLSMYTEETIVGKEGMKTNEVLLLQMILLTQ
jgi:hypothetical protein